MAKTLVYQLYPISWEGGLKAMTEHLEIINDLGADSLDLVDFVMSLEDEFDKEIPDEDVENIRTIGDIVSYIENSL